MSPNKIIEIFFCCSNSEQDQQMRQKLENHLSTLKWQGIATSWHQGMISPGKEWESEIESRLKTADIILLLISSEFTASEYHWKIFVEQAMERHRKRKSRVIPILLRRVDNWRYLFGKIKALPNDDGKEKPITDWRPYDNAFANIAEGIRKVIEEISDPSFYFKKSILQIKATVMHITNALATALINATFLFRRSRSRRKKVTMIAVWPILAFIVIIFLFSKLPHPSKIITLASSAPSSVTVGNVYNVHCTKGSKVFNAVRVRTQPSLTASYVSITCSETVTVTGKPTQTDDYWYPVKTSKGQTGYIAKVAINP